MSNDRLNRLKIDTNNDNELSTVIKYVRKGWPVNKSDVNMAARKYFTVRDEISESNGILLKGDKVIIPEAQRKYMLQKVHEGHMGIQSCQRNAR